jgi:parallel beta-helix repeat protein
VHELGSSDLVVEENSFDPDIRGYLSLSHFTSEGQIGERRVTANRGMREILLADVSDAADSGVHHTVIKDNHVVDDLYNDGIGIRLDRGTHNTISGNTIIHPPDLSDGFPGAGIGLGFATTLDRLEVSENTVEKNIVNNFVMGIMLDWTTQNIVSQNSLYGNANGMWLNSTTASTITANTFRYNVYNMSVGRYANAGDRPENNVIYDNLFGPVSGYTNVEFIGFSYKPNVWNVDKSQGPNIVGGPYIGGNYWADVPGVDLDLDGLGDGPYEIVSNNVDNLPLIIQGVNSIGDASDRDPADGICDTGATILRDSTSEPECTLRAAIEHANAREGKDRVFFNIPGTTTPVITPMHALPSITDTVIIDGTTQPGSGRVKVSGTGAGAANGLDCLASDLVVLVGLDIEGFAGHGVFFNPGGATNLSVIDSTIRGNRGWGLYQASERGFEPLIARDSVISGNLQGGMYLWTGLARGSRNLTIVENGFWGIFNHGKGLSGDIELETSRIVGNGGDGIHSWSSWARVIAGGYPDSPMIISGNAGDGIESGGSVMVDHAVIEENGRYGIKADGEDGVIAMDTRIAVNGAGGILAEEGISLAERLTVSDNNGHGIHARGTGNRRGPGSAGMLGQATIAGNSGDGIRSESGELLLTDSRIFANGQTGVRSFDGLYAKNLLVLGNGRDGLYIGGDVQLDRGESCRNEGTDLVIGGLSTVSRFTSGDKCRVTDFTADPLLGTAPVSVSFTSAAGENHSPLGEPAANEDGADNEVFTTRWDFGDGSTSTLTNPDHTYTEPGSYTVRLTQMLGDGLSRTEFKTDHVVVEAACTTDADCDDGLWCNGVESCDNGYCRQASPVCGEDGLYCNGLSWCDEEGDQCMTTPAPCLASGAFCNEETDSCTLATDLQAVFIHLGLLAGKAYCNPDLQMQDRTGNGRAGLAEAMNILQDLAD